MILFVLVAAQAHGQTRKASTPEDRAKVVEIARSLEVDPLSKQAEDQRGWLILWLMNVSDINVKGCSIILGPALGLKNNYSSELAAQALASGAAFIISNPDKAKDEVAVYAASLEGALRAYASILKSKPQAKWPYLDDLIEKQRKGKLAGYVRQVAAACK